MRLWVEGDGDMKSKYNLVIKTRHLANSKEDHLTEFFAALLITSPCFRSGFLKLVLDRHLKLWGWKGVSIVDVETQYHYDIERSRPDIILHLSNGKKIAVENKIKASETVMELPGEEIAPSNDKSDKKVIKQLEKYLGLPDINGLVYIRENWNVPDEVVLNHCKYLKPLKAAHYQWHDFYNLLSKDKTTLGKWMKEYFELYGYTPADSRVGDMGSLDVAEKEASRKNFVKLMDRTRSLADDLGWKYGKGCICEHYFARKKTPNNWQLFISPAQTERYLIRYTPNADEMEIVKKRLQAACRDISAKLKIPVEMRIHKVSRKVGKIDVIDVTTTLRSILGKAKKEGIKNRLLDFHRPLLMALEQE